eukprot:GHUV01035637.1.p1 GENE.GHUV01035637.1~~GHUV01035637.1.p1  ORF type:complete len:157 (+),score=18.90 GHUV01035637.1:182-652(+)
MPSATASSGLSGEQTRVGVIGGGAWGTALAIHCARMGHEVTLWALEEEVVSSVNGTNRENSTFLPGHKCPDTLTATSNMTEAVANSELVLMVVPTPYIAATVKPIADLLRSDQIFVSCTKVGAFDWDRWLHMSKQLKRLQRAWLALSSGLAASLAP